MYYIKIDYNLFNSDEVLKSISQNKYIDKIFAVLISSPNIPITVFIITWFKNVY